jgi:hypothetical protein
VRIKVVLVLSLLVFFGLTASGSASARAAAVKCVTVYDFPDAGEKVCVFTEGPCLVGEYRTTFLGTDFHCIVSRPGARSSQSAAVDPIPPCVREVIEAAPGFVLHTVTNLVENGELPRIMGPFLPC